MTPDLLLCLFWRWGSCFFAQVILDYHPSTFQLSAAVGITGVTPHTQRFSIEMESCRHFLPRLALMHDPLHLSLPGSWDYRCEQQVLSHYENFLQDIFLGKF
jgi:hypothetical protein